MQGNRTISRSPAIFSVLSAVLILAGSCSSTKHVPSDGYLLEGYRLQVDNQVIDKSELKGYIKPKPNKKVLGLKFYLGLYNLSGTGKDNGLNRWLRKIGEEPVLFDEYDTEKNEKQISLYLKNKGYYYAEVSDTVRLHRKKARVDYEVQTGRPYVISDIAYHFEDTTIRKLVLADTLNSLLHRRQVLDADNLQRERSRIERHLKQNGYFNFNKDYVYCQLDTSRSDMKVAVNMEIKKYLLKTPAGEYRPVPHRQYYINRVTVFPDFAPKKAFSDPRSYRLGLDSLKFEDFTFLYDEEFRTDPAIIAQSIYILPGQEYRLEDFERTYQHLSNLRIFKLVNIEYYESDSVRPDKNGMYPLNCQVQLSPMTLQNYSVELTGTNSSGNIGVAGNLNYQHRNLFGGAENFRFGVKGALEALRGSDYGDLSNMVEFGAESRISTPKFLLPFRHESFVKKYSPKTNFSISYNYQRRPDYTRTVANTTFGYTWRGNAFTTHAVNPLEINLVRLPYKAKSFEDFISGKFLQHSFEDKLIQAVSYSYRYNTQDIKRHDNFVYFKGNLESSGLLLSRVTAVVATPDDSSRYKLLGTEFSQYVKGDIEMMFYNVIDNTSSLAYRFFAGVAEPYGNSVAIPFEKQYFSGGANGVRAWQVRNLGPGSYSEPDSSRSSYPNKTADIKLEANLEYRFKLFWVLEGALFLDAGNVWAISREDERPGALFEWDRFYKEIAIGTGFGARMDFSYFIFRIDLGVKLKDPEMPEGSRWIPGSRGLRGNDFQLNLAIGYPF